MDFQTLWRCCLVFFLSTILAFLVRLTISFKTTLRNVLMSKISYLASKCNFLSNLKLRGWVLSFIIFHTISLYLTLLQYSLLVFGMYFVKKAFFAAVPKVKGTIVKKLALKIQFSSFMYSAFSSSNSAVFCIQFL